MPVWLLAWRLRGSWYSFEQPEINGLGHCLITCIVGMQVVTGVVRRQQFLRFVRIARGGVEVDNCVVGLAGPDPLVDRLALRSAQP